MALVIQHCWFNPSYPWPGLLCRVFGHYILFSQCLSSLTNEAGLLAAHPDQIFCGLACDFLAPCQGRVVNISRHLTRQGLQEFCVASISEPPSSSNPLQPEQTNRALTLLLSLSLRPLNQVYLCIRYQRADIELQIVHTKVLSEATLNSLSEMPQILSKVGTLTLYMNDKQIYCNDFIIGKLLTTDEALMW